MGCRIHSGDGDSRRYLLHERQYDESIKISEKAIEKQPGFAPAWNNLSLAWFEKGDYDKAAEYADKAIEFGFDVRPEYLEEIAAQRNK